MYLNEFRGRFQIIFLTLLEEQANKQIHVAVFLEKLLITQLINKLLFMENKQPVFSRQHLFHGRIFFSAEFLFNIIPYLCLAV